MITRVVTVIIRGRLISNQKHWVSYPNINVQTKPVHVIKIKYGVMIQTFAFIFFFHRENRTIYIYIYTYIYIYIYIYIYPILITQSKEVAPEVTACL